MTDDVDTTRLLSMIEIALVEADRQDNTLAAALLVECIEAINRQRTRF